MAKKLENIRINKLTEFLYEIWMEPIVADACKKKMEGVASVKQYSDTANKYFVEIDPRYNVKTVLYEIKVLSLITLLY